MLGNKEIMSKNIKKYMNEFGLTRNKLANDLDIKYTTLTDWIKGNTYPRIDKIELMAKYFHINKSDLIEDKSSLPDNTIPVNKVVKIPVIGTIACGTPILAEQNISSYEYLPASLIPEDGKVFFLKCKGNSMEPTIKNGSLVLIHQQPYVDDNEIAAVEINEEATLKRIKHLDGQILLMPDNKDYSPIILKKHDDNRILGKAIQVINKL